MFSVRHLFCVLPDAAGPVAILSDEVVGRRSWKSVDPTPAIRESYCGCLLTGLWGPHSVRLLEPLTLMLAGCRISYDVEPPT